eukprot:CAMPEP_0201578876 /NCGR_PEP_ID=MMETSP0190_2-20130828/25974_1 /ASSEMBLY_ACC=CAM_ASM_000263 /TAXON_ID=37353 /ORGANISM="Rosalina sp." /LENGTH=277 /DNA_ID=CAMNT_0048012539 /DNA_START=1 /DNA_END=831 /DNA_ORIENTATION=+
MTMYEYIHASNSPQSQSPRMHSIQESKSNDTDQDDIKLEMEYKPKEKKVKRNINSYNNNMKQKPNSKPNTKKREGMMVMDDETKQFYNFLKEHRLEKYFDKFKESNCAHIGDVEYLDDDEFLEKDIGITHKIERKRLMGECRKLKERMKQFKKVKMSEILRQKLHKYGIVTIDILCKECENKFVMKTKFGFNDKQCECLWNIIENKESVNDDNDCNVYNAELADENVEGEGVANADVNVIDTMHGYKLNENQYDGQNDNDMNMNMNDNDNFVNNNIQ